MPKRDWGNVFLREKREGGWSVEGAIRLRGIPWRSEREKIGHKCPVLQDSLKQLPQSSQGILKPKPAIPEDLLPPGSGVLGLPTLPSGCLGAVGGKHGISAETTVDIREQPPGP